ncbi:hypothetical protein HPB51_021678 [Rhipicephalus microplus]|uniref:Endonuclease/exonuclease/phosphatase domain-containing protein n=1 Tax=Rhipicephalus microplus TaxID=6941 RepID=A0A9J6D742_RHIMP|nr:hypothetical protein HPB51_021678 [Rhipicephalus microplus]
MALRVATWNVGGFRDKIKQRELLAVAQALEIYILFIQETNFRFRRKAHCIFEEDGRSLMLDAYINGWRVRFVYIYAPVTRTDTNAFFRGLHDNLQEPLPHVLLGDFNCVVDSTRDIRGPGRGKSTFNAKELVRIRRHLSFTDAWVQLHDNLFVPTRVSRTTASRIDRIYVPDFLLPSVVSC